MVESGEDRCLRVKFLDVGQGDAIVVLLPEEGRALIVDAFDGERVLKVLEEESITEVVLFLSHSDGDHVRGVEYLLDNFHGKYLAFIYSRDRFVKKPEASYVSLLRLLASASTPGIWSDDFNTGRNHDTRFAGLFGRRVSVEVLHPTHPEQSALIGTSTNEASGVLRIEHQDDSGRMRAVLLTGDIQLTGISCMMHRMKGSPEKLRAEVMKFPHHGSWPTDYPGISQFKGIGRMGMADLLKAVDPAFVVLSAGLDNSCDHVDRTVFEALEKLHGDGQRLQQVACTQFTRTCLRNAGPCKSPACCGDIEVRLGGGSGGLSILPGPAKHLDRILAVTDKASAGCGWLLGPK